MLLNANIERAQPTKWRADADTVRGRASGASTWSGIFETGFFEIDDNWALHVDRRRAEGCSRVGPVNQIELNVDDLNRAAEIAQGRREGGGRALHHHHLDGAEQATAGRAARWSGW